MSRIIATRCIAAIAAMGILTMCSRAPILDKMIVSCALEIGVLGILGLFLAAETQAGARLRSRVGELRSHRQRLFVRIARLRIHWDRE